MTLLSSSFPKLISRGFAIGAALFIVAGTSKQASAVVITFDEAAIVTLAGQIIDTEYQASRGVTFTGFDAAGSSNPAVVFDTNNFTGEDSDLQAPFNHVTDGAANQKSPGNILILHERRSECNAAVNVTP